MVSPDSEGSRVQKSLRTPILVDAMKGNKLMDISHTRFNDLAAKLDPH